MRLILNWSLAAVAAALLPLTANATNLLIDGEFDLATTGTQTSGSPWVLTANSPDGSNKAAQFQTGFANANNTGVGGTQAPGTGTGIWFRSFEGNQGGSGEPLALASVMQTIAAPSAGTYQLDFVAGREVNFTADEFAVVFHSQATGNMVTVDLLTAVIPDGNLGGAASPNPGGTPFSATLTGIPAGDLLSVSGLLTNGRDSQIPGGQSGFLDNFSVTLVPEPTTALLASLAVIGLVGVRRR